jgi:putative oxidoreductase
MNTALWIVQILLGAMMMFLGIMKTFLPVEQLSKLSWTTRSPEAFIKFVGISELLIGLGLILPQLTGIKPELTSWAAISLCIVMALASVEHIKYHERNEIWKNVLISMLGVFVAVGRFIPLH